MSPEKDIGVALRNGLRLLTAATVVLYAVVAVAVAIVWLDSANKRTSLRRDESRTNTALCALRADIAQRIKTSDDFLATHPNGIPGVPVATLRASADSQRTSVKALSGLVCPS